MWEMQRAGGLRPRPFNTSHPLPPYLFFFTTNHMVRVPPWTQRTGFDALCLASRIAIDWIRTDVVQRACVSAPVCTRQLGLWAALALWPL